MGNERLALLAVQAAPFSPDERASNEKVGASLAPNNHHECPMTRFAPLLPTAVFAVDSASNQTAGGSSTAAFVASVAAGNLVEIESSKLALDRTESDRVKGFANRMIEDHGAAGASSGRPSATPTSLRQPKSSIPNTRRSSTLSRPRTSGSFDKAYIDAQSNAHVETIDLFKAYVRGGDHWRMRQFADDLLPTLHAHLDHVKKMR